MPRSPILDREIFFAKLPNGSLYRLPFSLVNTPSGGMVETVSIETLTPDALPVNVNDVAADRITVIDPNTVFDLLNTSGLGDAFEYSVETFLLVSAYWLLGVSGSSELGVTTILGL